MGSHARETPDRGAPERTRTAPARAAAGTSRGSGRFSATLVTSLQRTAGNAAVSRALGGGAVVQRAPDNGILGGGPSTTSTVTLYHYGDLSGQQTVTSSRAYPRLTDYGLGTTQAEAAMYTGTPIRPSLRYRYELTIDADYFAKNFVDVGTRKGYSEYGTTLKIPVTYFRQAATLNAKPGGGGPAGGIGGQTPPVKSGGGGVDTKASGGKRATAAAGLAILGLNIAFNWVIGWQNERDIRAALERAEPQLRKIQQTDPSQGILLALRFTGAADSGEGPTAAGRFADLSYTTGRSLDDARTALQRKPTVTEGRSAYTTFWIPPLSPVAVPPATWSPVAVGTFADPSRIEFERLRFAQIGGFSTGRSYGPVDLSKYPELKKVEFIVLRMPSQIPYRGPGGGAKKEEVTVADRAVAGGTVPAMVVDGDPVVAVVAGNELTLGMFHARGAEGRMKIDDKVGALEVPNLSEVRWLAPGQVRLLRKL